jgi:hypothetical protein
MNTNLKVGDGRDFISLDRLQALRALSATSPAPHASGIYRQVNTMDVVNMFASAGWFPVQAQEQRVVKVEKAGFQKHMVRFRRPQDLTGLEKLQPGVHTFIKNGEIFPEIVMTNAHDTSSAYRLLFGLFRLACSNGLIVSEGTFNLISIPHRGIDKVSIREVTEKFVGSAPALMGGIQKYRDIILTPNEQGIYARSALIAKQNPEDDVRVDMIDDAMLKIGDRIFDTKRLLMPMRSEDRNPTLWNTMNVVQEKLTKGVHRGEGLYEMNVGPRRRSSRKAVRPINSIDENVRVNRALWNLMDEMAKQKQAA